MMLQIPVDLNLMLGPYKYSLQATVYPHRYFTVVIILLLSIVVEIHSITMMIELRNAISIMHITLQLYIYILYDIE